MADGADPGARGGVTRDRRGAGARHLSVRRDALLPNANRFTEEIRSLLDRPAGAPAWVCIDCAAIGDIDDLGGETLFDLLDEMKEKGSSLVLAELDDGVRTELDRYGLTEAIGADAIFDTVAAAVVAFGSEIDPRLRRPRYLALLAFGPRRLAWVVEGGGGEGGGRRVVGGFVLVSFCRRRRSSSAGILRRGARVPTDGPCGPR